MMPVLISEIRRLSEVFWTWSARALHTVPVEERHIDLAEARHTGLLVEAAGPSLAVEEERRIGSALEVVVRSLGAGAL
jgi:hypothetical protein